MTTPINYTSIELSCFIVVPTRSDQNCDGGIFKFIGVHKKDGSFIPEIDRKGVLKRLSFMSKVQK